jgi:hypothetical protein
VEGPACQGRTRVIDGDFTPQQLQAITAADGPLAIVAGPGCGKTMLSLPLRLFSGNEGALRVLQDAYQWVMADEVPDLRPIPVTAGRTAGRTARQLACRR